MTMTMMMIMMMMWTTYAESHMMFYSYGVITITVSFKVDLAILTII